MVKLASRWGLRNQFSLARYILPFPELWKTLFTSEISRSYLIDTNSEAFLVNWASFYISATLTSCKGIRSMIRFLKMHEMLSFISNGNVIHNSINWLSLMSYNDTNCRILYPSSFKISMHSKYALSMAHYGIMFYTLCHFWYYIELD